MDALPAPTTSRTMLPRSRTVSLPASSRSRSRASSRSEPLTSSLSPEPEQARAPEKRQPAKRRKKDVSNTTPRKRRRKETVKEGEPETGLGGVVVEELSTGPLVSPDVDQENVTGLSEIPAETAAEEKHEPAQGPESEPLSSYNCPICFTPPTNATLTPCGHICCGSCLFTAVKVAKRRAGLMMGGGELLAKCPVCRATIPGWDGRGGGVIGLKARTLFSVE
ncbi:hypothetical protein IW261DRAFT_1571274 [Armillaria novae-zelandiae]|uniref:RING-type domain-containing protein n=1 Tax=Armillaria novae-zelandiae TaxID=153914 RepID=A0AA39NUC2_9AGAR|nr:hypothetical protein IW261DRAFT_1571274 [Armillaria novae-zelandiae]